MRYEIKGGSLPYVEVTLDPNESIKCQGGGMCWKSQNVEMETKGGGIGKMFTKAFTGESLFHNIYTASGNSGIIAFASSFPGNIIAVQIQPGKDVICQKSAFLASTTGVEISVFFQRKLGAGLVGGEGFIMQRLTGSGIAFLEIDGSAENKYLRPGEQIVIDTGYLAMMDSTCSMDVQSVGGIKNSLLGGEGFFNTVVTGPGNVTLQSMPASKLVNMIATRTPSSGN